jgi:hypothetical protein
MKGVRTGKCYMCNAAGTTREHVPPDCFFPKGYRENLITVPSCPGHNTNNSKDVEYVRNIIVTHFSTNDLARGHFQDKALRSLERSPKLFTQSFGDARPIILDGQESGITFLDLPRFKTVMGAIAHAIHFKFAGTTYPGRWEIFGTSMASPAMIFEGKPDGSEELRLLLRQLSPTELPMPQPEVFACGVKQWDEERLVYEFKFYGGFVIHVVAMPPSYCANMSDAETSKI